MFQLVVNDLSKSYGNLEIFKHLHLKLKSGQTYCLMGASGSGKTTLFRILLGLEPADSGSFSFSIPQAKPLVAVFQEDRLCEAFSPLDNVRMVADGSYTRQMLFEELCRLLPEESVLRPVSTLSGGMKRRTAIVRALLAPSCGILMDEPFTGLDEETKKLVISYIKEKAAGKLLFIATHQPEDLALLGGTLVEFPK